MSAARLSSGPKLVAERRKADCSSEALTTNIKHIISVLKGHMNENLGSEFQTPSKSIYIGSVRTGLAEKVQVIPGTPSLY
jgi:hypothetical protein